MKVIDVIQGSPEWLCIRSNHFTASEAPAMMGASKYLSRTELLRQKATGIVPDVDAAKQTLFDRGHDAEAGARSIIEAQIGTELFPVTATLKIDGLNLLASLDGISMDETIIWEHKLWSDDLAFQVREEKLGAHYYWQLEQALLVTGAEKAVFTCSDGTAEKMVSMEYWSQPERRAQLIAGWKQFEKDLESYQHVEHAEKPQAEAIMQLPAVVINATGGLSVCNLREIAPRFDAFLSGAKTSLVTDDDFANGEATAKFSRNTAKTLKMKAKEVIGQIATVSEAVNTLELYAEKFDKLGLVLEKAVKEQKESIKLKIIGDAKHAFMNHVNALYEETKPIEIPVEQPDFAGAMKGMRTIASLHNAVDTALAAHIIKADAAAKDIRAKLAWYREGYAAYPQLFADMRDIIRKDFDDFKLVVMTRIDVHEKAQAAKLEAERDRIRKEEEAKAQAKVAEADAALKKMQSAPVVLPDAQTTAWPNPIPATPAGMTMTIDPVGAPPPWQAARDRVGAMLDDLTLAELGLVERYITHREWVKAA